MTKFRPLGKRYVACPQCGKGLAQNWLTAREPEWQYCSERCAKVGDKNHMTAPAAKEILS